MCARIDATRQWRHAAGSATPISSAITRAWPRLAGQVRATPLSKEPARALKVTHRRPSCRGDTNNHKCVDLWHQYRLTSRAPSRWIISGRSVIMGSVVPISLNMQPFHLYTPARPETTRARKSRAHVQFSKLSSAQERPLRLVRKVARAVARHGRAPSAHSTVRLTEQAGHEHAVRRP
jgi:hypothetical protein